MRRRLIFAAAAATLALAATAEAQTPPTDHVITRPTWEATPDANVFKN